MCWQDTVGDSLNAQCVLAFRSLPVADRLTMVPLFAALLDYDSSPAVYERYDRMSARELFRQYGVSQRRAAACPLSERPVAQ